MSHAKFAKIEGVHPVTGLATDYLNHYNEIVMLLDLVDAMPECIADAADWRPKAYAEHFHDSGLAIADGVIAAYSQAPAPYRCAFEETVAVLDAFLPPAIGLISEAVETGNANANALLASTLSIAREMLGRLNGIIHGHLPEEEADTGSDDTDSAQALADAMF